MGSACLFLKAKFGRRAHQSTCLVTSVSLHKDSVSHFCINQYSIALIRNSDLEHVLKTNNRAVLLSCCTLLNILISKVQKFKKQTNIHEHFEAIKATLSSSHFMRKATVSINTLIKHVHT